MRRTLEQAKNVVLQYATVHFPNAQAVLLAGSWARGEAHKDSDIDVVIIDEGIDRVIFEGVQFDEWIIEACVLNPRHASTFFTDSAKYRSAPVPHQVVDGVLVHGDPVLTEHLRKQAMTAIDSGPEPIPDTDRSETAFFLTLLQVDLQHASREALPALAAYAHVQLSKAALDARRCWRAESKALRRAVAKLDADLAESLDQALKEAIEGNPNLMIAVCGQVIAMMGGSERTYSRFSA